MNRLLLMALLLNGCAVSGISGSGRLETRDLPPGAFDKINASDTFHVEVTQGAAYSAAVTADDNLWQYVDLYNEGGTLHLGMKPGSYQNSHLSAKIVLPNLTGVEVEGAASATLRAITQSGNRFEMRLGGASSLDGELRCNNAAIDVSGASTVTLRGAADSLTLDVRDASHARLNGFIAKQTNVRVTGAADAAINTTGQLEFHVSGASRLSYAGKPSIIRAESSGASSVQPAK